MQGLDPTDEEYGKLAEIVKVFEEEIKDTEYAPAENREGEEPTFSRSLDNLVVILRFVQLLCENHNLNLQNALCEQRNAEGKIISKSVNIVSQMARMFENYQKVINSLTIGLGIQLVDTLVEVI